MMRPPVVIAIFFCLGIMFANSMQLNFWAIMAVAIATFALAILLQRKTYIFMISILILALLAGALSLKSSRLLSKSHMNNFVYYQDNSFYSLSGFVASQPELKDSQLGFIFRAQEIQRGNLKWRCCGKLLVKSDFAQELNYGDNLALIGNLTRPNNFNASSQNYKDYLARQDIYLIMRIRDPRQIIRLPGNSGSKLIRSSLFLRAKLEQLIRRHLAELPAGILSAMVLGQKRDVPWLVNNSMVRSGTVHILVVSGFNVGIVAFIINLLFKLVRIPRQARIILAIICLLIYCLVTGSTNPVVRATIMGIIYLSAYLFKRAPDMYNSLAISALIILLINPNQLFDIGFQLSFLSVLAIIYFYPKLEARVHLQDCRNKSGKFILQGCLVSFSAWLGTLGIIAFNFGIIAPVTVLANILIVPLATLITLCGFALVLAGLICPQLAQLVSVPTSMLINLLLNINAVVIKIPFAYFYL